MVVLGGWVFLMSEVPLVLHGLHGRECMLAMFLSICNIFFSLLQEPLSSYSYVRLAPPTYRGTAPIRKRTPLGPYIRPMPTALWWS